MQEFIDDQLPINDLFTENLSLVLQSYTKKSVVVCCDSKDVFLNPYGFAHGGFLYTIGHIAARNMALVCLNRPESRHIVRQEPCILRRKLLYHQFLGLILHSPLLKGHPPADLRFRQLFPQRFILVNAQGLFPQIQDLRLCRIQLPSHDAPGIQQPNKQQADRQ